MSRRPLRTLSAETASTIKLAFKVSYIYERYYQCQYIPSTTTDLAHVSGSDIGILRCIALDETNPTFGHALGPNSAT